MSQSYSSNGSVAVLTLLIFGLVFVAAIGGGVLMLGLNLVHRDLAVVPALGFRASFGAVLVVQTIGHALRGTKVEAS